MAAVAISNNDMVYLHWDVQSKIEECLGFTIIRHDAKGRDEGPLPAMVGFKGERRDPGKRFKTTNEWPVQKYAWKDLFAKRGGTYWYEVIPMLGTPGNLKPDRTRALRTNTVTLSPEHGSCAVFFNRGIISTQALARALTKTKRGLPSGGALQKAISDPNSPIRARLVGDLETGVLTLLKEPGARAKFYCALYELSDGDLIKHLTSLKKRARIVLSNAGEDTEEGSGDGDSTNVDARHTLHRLKLDVTDRMLKKGHIGHNKFVVYDNGRSSAVLSGSTNWTPTGLCAQSNNAIIVRSSELARDYTAYWDRLRDDTDNADGDGASLQGKSFRDANHRPIRSHPLKDGENKDAGTVQVWFSPNTKQKSVPRGKSKKAASKNKKSGSKSPAAPADLDQVFELIDQAKQGALFLAFIPGSPSIVSKLQEVYDARREEGKLFYLRGAATSPDPASLFRVDLYHRTSKRDATVRPAPGARQALRANASVVSVAGIFAAFAQWEAEIYKLGHAVIHDKILVLDPFTDDSVVITGSHNLGYKASYANDENMLIVRGNRTVAEAYAAHVLDVYEHYRWRWKLQQPLRDKLEQLKKRYPKAKSAELWQRAIQQAGPDTLKRAWQNLSPNDSWQDYYYRRKDLFEAEKHFWSPLNGEALAPS